MSDTNKKLWDLAQTLKGLPPDEFNRRMNEASKPAYSQMSAVVPLFPDLDPPKPATEANNAAFDMFWAAYPKRVGKPLAKAKFMSIIKGGCETKTFEKDSNSYVTINLEGTAEEIVAGAKAYTRSLIDLNTYKRKIEDRFIPAAAVWLNRGGWMDF